MKQRLHMPSLLIGSIATIIAVAIFGLTVPGAFAKRDETPTMSTLFNQALSDIEGRTITLTDLEYPPGAEAPPHHHPAHTVVYVVSGHIESSVDDKEVITYGPGDVWYESPNQLHATFRNPSKTEAFQAIAFMLRESDKPATLLGSAHQH